MAYALHTGSCTYLLDEQGVCRWIVAPQGVVPPHVRKAVGAQFLACLALGVPGGLVGELTAGAMALFVRHEGDRMVLLRTGAIQHVDDRREQDGTSAQDKLPPAAAADQLVKQYGKQGGLPYMAKPPPKLSVVKHLGEEATITVSVTSGTAIRRVPPQSD